MAVSAFPWGELARVPRGGMRAMRAIREWRSATAGFPTAAEVSSALGQLVASEVAIAVHEAVPFSDYGGGSRAVVLQTGGGAVSLAVEPEPALASVLLARLLNRPPPLTDPAAELGPRSLGALAALAVETARRAGTGSLLEASHAPLSGPGLRVRSTVRVDGKPYGLTLWVVPRALASARVNGGELSALGELPLTLVAVASISAGDRADVAALAPGDVWVPGSWLTPSIPAKTPGNSQLSRVLGRVALASPAGERGIEAAHSESGKFVVRGGVIALAADEPGKTAPSAGVSGGATMEIRDDTLREIALDAPVVVRIEVASITLSAREWSALSPGDVIGTGVRLAPAVVLRVAGREVARGDLVDIDGELGVSIRELVDPGASP